MRITGCFLSAMVTNQKLATNIYIIDAESDFSVKHQWTFIKREYLELLIACKFLGVPLQDNTEHSSVCLHNIITPKIWFMLKEIRVYIKNVHPDTATFAHHISQLHLFLVRAGWWIRRFLHWPDSILGDNSISSFTGPHCYLSSIQCAQTPQLIKYCNYLLIVLSVSLNLRSCHDAACSIYIATSIYTAF